jgi:N-acetylglutamate synthase-like GNAT family acetyltransferase
LQDLFRRASLSNEGDRGALLDHPEHLILPEAPVLAGRTRVAERMPDGQVVGFATVDDPDDGAAELVDLFVDPDAMRQGVARTLIDDAVSRLRAAGVSAVEVTGNDHASAFYAAVGFEQVGWADTPLGTARRLRLEVPA